MPASAALHAPVAKLRSAGVWPQGYEDDMKTIHFAVIVIFAFATTVYVARGGPFDQAAAETALCRNGTVITLGHHAQAVDACELHGGLSVVRLTKGNRD